MFYNLGLVHKARQKYNLQGIDNRRLLTALDQTNGDIEKAILLLTK